MNWRLKIALTAVLALASVGLKAQDIRALEVGTSVHFSFASGEYKANQYHPTNNQVLILRYNLPYRVAIRASIGKDYKYLNESIYKDAKILHVDKLEELTGAIPAVEKQWNIKEFDRLTIAFEYHFKDFNVYDERTQFSPYLMIGLSHQSNFLTTSKINNRIKFWNKVYDEDDLDEEGLQLRSLILSDLKNENFNEVELSDISSIRERLEGLIPDVLLNREKNPFSLKTFSLIGSIGVKYRLSSIMILSAEIAGGYFFSDDYDYNISPNIYSFRNRSGNDFYLYPNLTLSVSLGPLLRLFND
jgi:hypothetical protein